MSSNASTKRPAVLMLAALLIAVTAAGQRIQVRTAPKSGAAVPPRVGIDISKLVWPMPPAPTRLRYLSMLTGEKIDWKAVQAAKTAKPKQGWMDRLAGSKPLNAGVKIPFQLIRTYGVAVDSKNNIYAADQAVGAIFVFNLENKSVELIRNGEEANFGLINGIAIDDNDRIFVTDAKFHQVLVFNAQRRQEASFGGDVLARPCGIAIDTENRFLYVVDTENDVVVVFDADTFRLLRKIGVAGKRHRLSDPGTFSLPTHVAVDKDGNVYVTDTLNNRIEIFDADGNFLSMFGRHGDAPGQLARPKGIAVDADGHIWVADAYQDRLEVFDREGNFLIDIGGHGSMPGQFQEVYGIAIDKNNRVITSEQYAARVQVFQYVTDAEAEAATRKPAAPADAAAKPAGAEVVTKK